MSIIYAPACLELSWFFELPTQNFGRIRELGFICFRRSSLGSISCYVGQVEGRGCRHVHD